MSDETITELARLLAEATRARRLAEAAAMDERCGARAFERNQAADEARRVAEQRSDELRAAEVQIAELSDKLAQAENAVRWQRERAEIAQAEMDRMQLTRSQMLVGRAGDASRLEQELRVLREEIATEKASTANALAILERERDDLRRELADARAALAAAHEHDAAEVARLRALLQEVVETWRRTGSAGPPMRPAVFAEWFEVIERADRASRGGS